MKKSLRRQCWVHGHKWRGWTYTWSKGHFYNACMRCGKNKYRTKLRRWQ